MNFTLGIFDLFSYAIPGSLYLALLAYMSERLGWVSFQGVSDLNTTLLLIGAALACYLFGHITYELAVRIESTLPSWKKGLPDARREFPARAPGQKAKSLVQVDPFLLQAALEVHAKEAATEISRIRAVGLMLRNSFPALTLASLVSLVELITGDNRPLAAFCTVLFLLAAFAALRHGWTLRQWAISPTLERTFWMESIDEMLKSLKSERSP
jgi:hypothetical protein